ncbi:MAG TPA: LAGLIDADG family homing endonuclease [Candidatus Paceibacterota bacterium]
MPLLDFLKKKKEDTVLPSILPGEVYEAANLELRDIIAPSALKISPKQLNLGEKIARSFFVISYPRYLTDNWFSPVVNLDKVFDVAIHVHPVDTSAILRTFQKKVAEVQSQISMREDKGLVRDPKLDTAYQDLENLRDQLQQAQERLFEVGLYITIYGDDETELDKLQTEIKTLMDARLVYIKPSLFQQEQGFRSTLPMGYDELMVHSKLNTSPLSSIFPFVSFDLTSDKGILYGINRHNSSLVLFDRFSLENYNSITFAKSGSGKSVHGDEVVLVKEDSCIALQPIRRVVDDLIRREGITYRDEELEGVYQPNLQVFSFDKEMKGGWSKVSVAARKVAPDTLYTFTTKSGRAVTTTADHNMVVLKNGDLEVAKSDSVKIGDSVPLPRKIAGAKHETRFLNTFSLLKTERRLYIVGGRQFIDTHYETLKKTSVDRQYDRYLYNYRQGRRVPIRYFSKIFKVLHIEPNESLLKVLSISSSTGDKTLPALLPITQAFMATLGYIAAEGSISEQVVTISNTDREVINNICASLNTLGVPHFETHSAVVVAFQPFIALLKKIGAGGKSATKRVAPFIFNCSNEAVGTYLRAYFEGDGGIDGAQVTAVSKSRQLISDIAYLFLFLRIIARIHPRQKMLARTKRRRTYWQIAVSGQENLSSFADYVGFISKKKRDGLQELLGKCPNTNVDVVPGTQNLIAQFGELVGPIALNISSFSPLSRGVYQPSPKQLLAFVAQAREQMKEFRELRGVLEILSGLPVINTTIKLAAESKDVNRALWKSLGSSWAVAKSGRFEARSKTALTVLEAMGSAPSVPLAELKQTIRRGCATLDIDMVRLNPSLGPALRNSNANTSYTMLQKAAQFIWEQYTTFENRLPQAESVLSKLEQLARSDLFWDPIVTVEVKKNQKEKYVYDLTVDNEVFLAGRGGMFVHNSYSTKLEILRTLMFDTDVIVIDPEREYEHLAEVTGGRYFNISLNSEHHINPFDLPIPHEDESSADVLRSNIINLVGLFRIMLGGLTPEEDALVDRAITETYALKDITPDSDFSKAEAPLMSDFELVLSGMEGSQSLVQKLSKYTRGTWSGFINRTSNVSVENKFIVFSIRDMEDELKPVAMYIVMHYIWNAIRRNLKKRLLVIDEAWWMMKSDDTASFLLSLAKRGRKYYLGLATITQDVDDFLKSPYGLPILTNSSIQMLLKQSPTAIDRIQQVFNLTDEEKYLLLESDVGEGIFFLGLKHVAIKIIASYTEDQIITSDPSQLLAIKKAKQDLAMQGGGGTVN